MKLPIDDRKWYIDKFIEQNKKEKEAMEAEQKKGQSRR